MAKPVRARTQKRAEQREHRKLVRLKEKLAAKLPGGSADNPVEVPAASVIELRARSTPCPQCGGNFQIAAHRAPALGLRSLEVICQMCGAKRDLWFRIVATGPN